MIRRLHPVAGAVALLTIATFWTTTVLSELSGDLARITFVKHAILWGLLLLVPAVAMTGGTGFKIAGARRVPLIQRKKRRMPIIAANGFLVLVPCAFFLADRAADRNIDTAFVVVQSIELVAGAINIFLLSRSMADGFRLTGKLKGNAAPRK